MKTTNILKEKREKLGLTRKEFSDSLNLSREQEKLYKHWENNEIPVPEDILEKVIQYPTTPPYLNPNNEKFKMIDLFAGIGGLRLGFQKHGGATVFSSEWDKFAQKTYRINYGETPYGDITKIKETEIPPHDILLAGFPCQPFSLAGKLKGFEDTRGTLFFDVARIIKEKRPKAFLLENVKNFRTHDQGRTLKTVLKVLEDLDYYVPDPMVLNAKDFGLPQNRERIFIAGFDKNLLPNDYEEFTYPTPPKTATTLSTVLEDKVDEKYTISNKLYEGHLRRLNKNRKNGKGFGVRIFDANSPYSSTITARYYKDGSEALLSQTGKNPRMLTPREVARLQGFPDNFIIPVSNTQAYKQFGNSVAVPVIEAIAEEMIKYSENYGLLKPNED